jgi:predicted permease
MNAFLQDVLYALRQLRKNPGFTATVVLTLALGIGANAAIFSVVNAVLLRPLPYKDDGKLVVMLHDGRNPVAPANFLDWRAQNHVFERTGAAEFWTPNLTGSDNPEKLWGLHVTSDIFPMLGVEPLLGRGFLPEEQQSGKDHEVVLGYRIWQERFAGDAHIVGHQMALDGATYTIVGVMPRGFEFAPFWATNAQLWAPLSLSDKLTDRGGNSLRVFARLKPGATLAEAQAEVAVITSRLEKEFPGTNRNVEVVSLRDKVVGNIRPALLVLLGAVGFVLLMACANVCHLLLARGAARQREIAVRSALGAQRWQLLRQFLVECLILALSAGGLGILLAVWGVRALPLLSSENIPRVQTVAVDGSVLLFALAVSIFAGLAFGLIPAWRATAVGVGESLKDGGRSAGEGVRHNRLRGVLVCSEFAFAVILLAGAGLMIRTMVALHRVDPGFNPHNVLSMVIGSAGVEHAGPYYQQFLQNISALPGVQSVSGINHLPIAGDQWGQSFHIQGRPTENPGEEPGATYRAVFPGYFRTMGIPILRGRDISGSDDARVSGVVVINDYMARRYWPGEDPIGKRITFDDPPQARTWLTVVGVAKNTVRHDWASPPEEEVFVPYLQTPAYFEHPALPFAALTLVIRTTGDPSTLIPDVRAAIRSLDRNTPVSEIQTMEQVVTRATGESRFYLTLLGAFASVALVLAGLGIYGVMSHSVSRRKREIGIRMALGAQVQSVLRLVVSQGMLLASAGVAAGLIGALALTRLMSGLLYGTRPADLATFVAVVCLLGVVAVAATYLPARRATKVDPVVALRYE